MSTYVINNRIPHFPIGSFYPDRTALQKRLEDVFQIWLKESLISNLVRRKACSQLYDYSCWMSDQGRIIEAEQPGHFPAWCGEKGIRPQSDWGSFLAYAHRRMPELHWNTSP